MPTTIDRSSLAAAFKDVYGIDPMTHDGTFSMAKLTEFALKVGLKVCGDREEKWSPGSAKFVGQGPAAGKFMATDAKPDASPNGYRVGDLHPVALVRAYPMSPLKVFIFVVNKWLSDGDFRPRENIARAMAETFEVLDIKAIMDGNDKVENEATTLLSSAIMSVVQGKYRNARNWPGSMTIARDAVKQFKMVNSNHE